MFNGHLKKEKIWSGLGHWAAEIVVVFIGVYLAFLLNGYRTERSNEHKKQQIYTALHNYIASIGFTESANSIASLYANPFLDAYQKKEMPSLRPLPFFTSNISSNTWEAMLQTGGIDLLDVNLILRIDDLFGRVRSLNQSIDHFNRMSDQYLLPYADTDISRFYDVKTKKVRPLYQWYIDFLKETPGELRNMRTRSSTILKILEEKMNKEQLEKVKADSIR